MCANWVAYDTETTGLNRHEKNIGMFAYSLGYPSGKTSVHRVDGKTKTDRMLAFQSLRELWDSKKGITIAKVAHNMKFDVGMTEKYLHRELIEQTEIHDTAIQASILMSNHYSFRLKDLCWDLAGIPKDDEKAVKRYIGAGENYSSVPVDIMNKYQHQDALRVVALHRFFYPKIQKDPKLLACYKNEMELLKVVLRMENVGLYLRRDACVALRERLQSESWVLAKQIGELCGRDDLTGKNLASAQMARELLFNGNFDFPILKRTKNTNEPSADKDTLMALHQQHPDAEILGKLLNYRSWQRGVAMMNSYLKFADIAGDGCIHPDMNTNGAHKTGRQSCSNPNLQNVEKGKNEAGKRNPYPVPAREVFGPRPGCVNFHIDYRGIELRLLVEYSGDARLIDEIRKEDIGQGGGPHNLAASYFYPEMSKAEARRWGITDADIITGFLELHQSGKDGNGAAKTAAKRLRDTGKNAHFAGPYGAGVWKLAATLNIPMELAQTRIEKYIREVAPNLFNLTNEVVREVRATNHVENIFGRRFYVSEEEAYMGTNYKIQGTAAEILKRAMVRIARFLQKRTGGVMRMLLSIHDEIVIECPLHYLREAPALLREMRLSMIDFPEFSVPMEIDVEISTVDWGHKYEFNINEEVTKCVVENVRKATSREIWMYGSGRRRKSILN